MTSHATAAGSPHTLQYPLPPHLPREPRAAFLALSRAPGAYWLDSGPSAGHHARYHFLGARPAEQLIRSGDHSLAAAAALLDGAALGPAPRPAARVIGYLSYELGRAFERIPTVPAPAPEPEVALAVYDAGVTYDLQTGEAWITAADHRAARALEDDLARPPRLPLAGPFAAGPVTPRLSRAAYEAKIHAVLELIAAGDVYQVNLSHGFEVPLRSGASPRDLYVALRDARPAAFGAYLSVPGATILSNSPEAFLSVDLRPGHGHVTTWPLKGTLPRSAEPAALASSAKDQAEHVMIVDLERNDLGRIAVPGSVRVPSLMEVVTHPTVHHLESRIEATPRDGLGLTDVLRATFPGGSITGAPKIRAMEIIANLEGERRGIYCGALGYVGWDGLSMHLSIPIRTAVASGGHLRFRTGGGIVADSDPGAEWEETLVKARAFTDLLAAR